MVERVRGPLSRLTPAVQALGCEVARAADAQSAVRMAESQRELCFVTINGEALSGDVAWLTNKLKAQHPDLPIFLFTSVPGAAAIAVKLDLVTSDLRSIESRISCLLREEVYGAPFVQQFVSRTAAVLGDFGMAAAASEPCIKATLTELSDVNAFVSLIGHRLSAHVVLSASGSHLTTAYRARFPKVKFPDLDDLEDLLGEMASQILGQVRRAIQLKGSQCRLGLPYFIRGSAASLRHKGGVPSLSIDFTSGKQRIHVDLCIDRLDSGTLVEAEAGEHLNPGVINFL